MEQLKKESDGSSLNIVESHIEQLKTLFPEVFSEGKIDFDKLKETLGDAVETQEERYNFTWNGKAMAKRIAQTPSTGTLRPCKAESKHWVTTQNLFIEGDDDVITLDGGDFNPGAAEHGDCRRTLGIRRRLGDGVKLTSQNNLILIF